MMRLLLLDAVDQRVGAGHGERAGGERRFVSPLRGSTVLVTAVGRLTVG